MQLTAAMVHIYILLHLSVYIGLFSATSHAHDSTLSRSDFIHCYQQLLQAQYEPEVLELDLKKAIKCLSTNSNWTHISQLLSSHIPQYLHTLIGNASSSSSDIQQQDGIDYSQPRNKQAIQALFASIQGKSTSLGPKQQQKARKVISHLYEDTPDNSIRKFSVGDIVNLYKKLLILEVPVTVFQKDLEQ